MPCTWNIYLTNREGREGQNSGVTLVRIERGKVCFVKDFIFDLGENFRRNWSAADVALRAGGV